MGVEGRPPPDAAVGDLLLSAIAFFAAAARRSPSAL